MGEQKTAKRMKIEQHRKLKHKNHILCIQCLLNKCLINGLSFEIVFTKKLKI